jgi:hypothetical protein
MALHLKKAENVLPKNAKNANIVKTYVHINNIDPFPQMSFNHEDDDSGRERQPERLLPRRQERLLLLGHRVEPEGHS